MKKLVIRKNGLILFLMLVTAFLAIANFSKYSFTRKLSTSSVIAETVKTQPSPSPVLTNKLVRTTNWWEYPSEITTIAERDVDITTVVDKSHKLLSTYVPPNLTSLKMTNYLRVRSGVMLRQDTADALYAMAKAAKKDEVDLFVRSSYRSYATQVETYNYWLNFLGRDVNATDKVSARPGHSEHQLGTAIDFSTNELGDALSPKFEQTKAYTWLIKNADRFGFKLSYPKGKETETGYSFEPWHWRWRGKDD